MKGQPTTRTSRLSPCSQLKVGGMGHEIGSDLPQTTLYVMRGNGTMAWHDPSENDCAPSSTFYFLLYLGGRQQKCLKAEEVLTPPTKISPSVRSILCSTLVWSFLADGISPGQGWTKGLSSQDTCPLPPSFTRENDKGVWQKVRGNQGL